MPVESLATSVIRVILLWRGKKDTPTPHDLSTPVVMPLTDAAHGFNLHPRRAGNRLSAKHMKRAARFTIVQPIVTRAASWLTRGLAPIITLHRFRDAEVGNAGHDPNLLRANLAWLRKNKYTPLPVTELIDRLVEGVSVQRTVAFTVDDGYADFVRVAAPIFAEFDCPVTVFLTTGFVDRRQWMWWDAVAVALSTHSGARRRDRRRDGGAEADSGAGKNGTGFPRCCATPAWSCRPFLLQNLAALGWDDVRRLSRRGVTVRPTLRSRIPSCRE